MADEKPKAPAKPAEAKPEEDNFVRTVEILLIILVLGALYSVVAAFFQRDPLFRQGFKGLTPHGIMLAYTRPVASLSNPVGGDIIVTEDPSTPVLNDAGGLVIGSQKFARHGKIVQGPIEVGGVRYYKVDFDKDPDGWIAEDRVAYRDSEPSAIARFILGFWSVFNYIWYGFWVLALILLILIIIYVRRLTKIRVNNYEKLYPVNAVVVVPDVNPKWKRVLTHSESVNENDWRLAIIEADIMLSELLDTMSLQGDSIGDKLKGVEKSDFLTLDSAWTAHKVRNQIAHAGSDFLLNQHETRRVIGLYEEVFREFQYI